MPGSLLQDRPSNFNRSDSPKDLLHDSNIFLPLNNSVANLPPFAPSGTQELSSMTSTPQTFSARAIVNRQRASTMPSIQPPARSSSLRRKPPANVTPDSVGTQDFRPTIKNGTFILSDKPSAAVVDSDDVVDEEEITSCLMNWKRRSTLKLNCRDSMFVDGDDDNVNTLQQHTATTDVEKEWQTIADALWRGEPCSLISKQMTPASFLGGASPTSQGVRQVYLAKFNFTNVSLDEAFRMLCARLFFKAEAQEIDRILEAFAHQYYACNVSCLYGSAEVVHSVVYSLMLLNTDLHIARAIISNHTPMTSAAFVNYTMITILDLGHEYCRDIKWQEQMRTHLEELYLSVRKNAFVRPVRRKTTLLQCGVGSLRRRGTKNTSSSSNNNNKNNNNNNNNNNKDTPPPPRMESLPPKEISGYLSFQANTMAYYRATIASGYLYISSQQQHTDNSTLNRSKSTGLKSYYHSCTNLLRSKSRRGGGTKTMDTEKYQAIALTGCRAFQSDLDMLLFYVCLQNGRTLILKSESPEKTREWVQQCNYWGKRKCQQ